MGCDGCLQSARGQQELYLKAKYAAQKLANQNSQPVAVWKEQFEWYYMDQEQASQSGKPYKEIVTPNLQ